MGWNAPSNADMITAAIPRTLLFIGDEICKIVSNALSQTINGKIKGPGLGWEPYPCSVYWMTVCILTMSDVSEVKGSVNTGIGSTNWKAQR